MVSLYICDVPQHVEKTDLDALFSGFQGFIECRVARDKNRYTFVQPIGHDSDKISFADFEKEYQAKFVIEALNGYRFPGCQKGICTFSSSSPSSSHTHVGTSPAAKREAKRWAG